ncbi:hypothetical protein AMV124 [Betaentomopoxvirus amoorei]|uniref:AMV124 n=1 Tax=Amsacta moorei entomopoxvirus TaxID=28321 RepID=Q9EMS5_AMEPV|nr:hypothetical protein AMV124 [Amsacta moorei entomopoxvirus]AAG02830.1 AMV124 [Amsacta moorei entomopoxvirus]
MNFLYMCVIIIIFLILLIYYRIINDYNENYNKYFLQRIHRKILNIQNNNFNTPKDMLFSASEFSYKVLINRGKINDFSILYNINKSDLDINNWYARVGIPRTLCMSIYMIKNPDLNIIKNLFIKFLKWIQNPLQSHKNVSELYSKCLCYIIIVTINKKYSLNIDINNIIYQNALNVFIEDLEIIPCNTLKNLKPGYYSDGSFTNSLPMIPSAISIGSECLDSIFYAMYILKIPVSDNLLHIFINMNYNEFNYYGCNIDNLGMSFTRNKTKLQILQIMCQILTHFNKLKSTINIKFLINNINTIYYNSILNLNLYPTIENNIDYQPDDIVYYDILTVSGIIRCRKNGFSVVSSNYTSFCYLNEYGNEDNLNISTRFCKCCIQIMDPNSLEYYNIINNNNDTIYNIQNILINDNLIEINGRDHAIVGERLYTGDLFSAKSFTFNYGRLQSYEIIHYSSIISINHITINNNNANNLKFIIFRWIKTDYNISDNKRKLYIADQYIETNYNIKVLEQRGFLLFYIDINITNIKDIIIGFSINRSLSSVIIRPDANTICDGLIHIKERRENKELMEYIFEPIDFDPDGIHYFELNKNLGFILYGPWDNVAIKLNNINIDVFNNGVRRINIISS